MAEEQLDEVDPATGAILGSIDRSVAHRQGRWHQVFHCLVVSPTRRTVLLQRRGATKSAFPSLLDFSATGHLEAGESPLDGRRELAEELGLEVAADALVPLGTRLLADDQGEGRNRELVHGFLVRDDRPVEAYHPAPVEVDAVVEIAVEDLLALLGDETVHRPAVEAIDGVRHAVELSRRDLVAGEEGYWVVMAAMAERLLDGKRPLAI